MEFYSLFRLVFYGFCRLSDKKFIAGMFLSWDIDDCLKESLIRYFLSYFLKSMWIKWVKNKLRPYEIIEYSLQKNAYNKCTGYLNVAPLNSVYQLSVHFKSKWAGQPGRHTTTTEAVVNLDAFLMSRPNSICWHGDK